MNEWKDCKNILCIRPDNMGDLIMSSPAISALKETFNCNITLLTSSMAARIVPFIPCIDDHIVFTAPWVKSADVQRCDNFFKTIEDIKERNFDAAVIFTTFSQNPLPTAMLPYMAGIPKRLAYCRENPYLLLTDWIADEEPYSYIQHQVMRDLNLLKGIGAETSDKKLRLNINKKVWPAVSSKLISAGIDIDKPWIICHAGVSESKREYPKELWIQIINNICSEFDMQVILTGNSKERELVNQLVKHCGSSVFDMAGGFTIEEFICLIKKTELVVSVNTATIHIAAAVDTPLIALYALSNPQHSPWMARGKVLPYDIPPELRSKNQVLQYVHEQINPKNVPMVTPEEVIDNIREVLTGNHDHFIPAMIRLNETEQIF